MKLLPQYSIRRLLVITTVVACVFSIVGLAARNHMWAIGVSLGVAGLAVSLATFAAFFGVLWVFSVVASPVMNRPLRPGKTTLAGTASPFASPVRNKEVERAVDAVIVNDSTGAVEERGTSEGGEYQS